MDNFQFKLLTYDKKLDTYQRMEVWKQFTGNEGIILLATEILKHIMDVVILDLTIFINYLDVDNYFSYIKHDSKSGR